MSKLSTVADDGSRLMRRYLQATDPRERKVAQQAIVVAHQPLARKLARRYRGRQIDVEDLEQVAYLGLVKALERFRPELGYPFGSFAVPTILGELRRHFRDHGWSVHVPRGLQELSQAINEANERSWSERGRPCAIGELAELLQKTPAEIQDAMQVWDAYAPGSLQAPALGSEGGEPIQVADRRLEFADEVVDLVTLAEAFQRLPQAYQQVLRWYFHDELLQSEIALAIGISQMQVSRRIHKALHFLRGLAGQSNQPKGVTTMARKSQLHRSPTEIAKVTSLLEENGGRLAGDSVMATLVQHTGRKASELNGLLAEMSGKNLVHRRFGDKGRLVELALPASTRKPAAPTPAKTESKSTPSTPPSGPVPFVAGRLRWLVAKIEQHGQDGTLTADSIEQAAQMLGYSPATLTPYMSEARKQGLLETGRLEGRYRLSLTPLGRRIAELSQAPAAKGSRQQSGDTPNTAPSPSELPAMLRAAADQIEALEREVGTLRELTRRQEEELTEAGRLQACGVPLQGNG